MSDQFLSSSYKSFLPRILDISLGKYFASIEGRTWFYLDNSSLALGWQQKGQALHMLNNIPYRHKHTQQVSWLFLLVPVSGKDVFTSQNFPEFFLPFSTQILPIYSNIAT